MIPRLSSLARPLATVFRGPVVALAALAAACGGNTAARTNATNTSSDSAHVAVQATEPRTGDPTAAAQARTIPEPAAVAAPAASSGSKAEGSKVEASPPAATTPAEAEPPKRVGARHVLVQWMGSDRAAKSVLRTREQAQAVAQEVLKRAKKGEDLGRLAVDYSDEPNAGARGGSLGRFTRGQMVPAFDNVAFKLKVGEISDIVETPFGFHIIQRTE